METPFRKKKTTLWGGAFCSLGLGLAILVVYLNDVAQPADRSLVKISLDLVLFGAMTLLSLGLVSMILDMAVWKEYIDAGLRNIVVHPEFLKSLNQEQLAAYEIEVFKSFYGREDIDQEGHFLPYCLRHIHKYIAAPYREEIWVEMRVEIVSEECLRVSETLRYICRMGEGGIQERLSWGMNEETLDVVSLRFELRPPEGQQPVSGKRVWNKADLQAELENGLPCYSLSLEPFRQMDRLGVTIEATYLSNRRGFNTWRMIVPSRNVTTTISYPKDLRLQFIPFLLDTRPAHETKSPGYYSAEFQSWIMPWSGFAWKLFPPAPAESQVFISGQLDESATGVAAAALH